MSARIALLHLLAPKGTSVSKSPPATRLVGLLSLAFLLFLAAPSAAGPQTFETPEAAALAFVEACRAGDLDALRDLVVDDDDDDVFELKDPGTKARLLEFAEAADRRLTLREDGEDHRTLIVGYNAYAFPVPVVRADGSWHFDGVEGHQEILDRTIGWNELVAISTLRDFVTAQAEYESKPRGGGEVRQYARHMLSTPGTQDGLYWEAAEGKEQSPFGPFVDSADAKPERGTRYYGYHYRVLTKQGKNAPAGKHSYEINGHLLAGVAAIAWPADYGRSGIKTFLVNHYGVVYEKDLGDGTAKYGKKTKAYDPGEGWNVVSD